ncbi:MAG: hypothetical protein GXO29_05990 [Thermotogae bacterium]|nr:hypothetical protein [Thermotogota bacterium]
MRRATFILLVVAALGCRYRFTPGIYVPLQVGVLYRYTSRYVLTGEYEKPMGRYYTPDSLLILSDTSYEGYEARKVFIKKQYECREGVCNPYDPSPECYCVADTALYYLKEDTLVFVAELSLLIPPKFRIFYNDRSHFVSVIPHDTLVQMPIFYTLADPGSMWEVRRGEATVKVWPEDYDSTRDSTLTVDISYRITAEIPGFEDVETSYGRFRACAKASYYIYMSGSSIPDITLHAMDVWWCDGVGQVKYVYTPEAAAYKDSTLTYMELSFIEEGL